MKSISAEIVNQTGTPFVMIDLMNKQKSKIALKMLRGLSLLVLLTILAAGCQKRVTNTDSNLGANSQAQFIESGGGVDTSGGNFVLNTDENVEKIFQDLNTNLYGAVYRLQQEIEYTGGIGGAPRRFSDGDYAMLLQFLGAKDRFRQTALQALKNNKIKYVSAEHSCTKDSVEKDASASFNKQDEPIICISKNRLKNLTSSAIEFDVLALGLHELSHLYGFDENMAVYFQEFALKNADLVWPSEDTFFDMTKNSLALVRKSLELIKLVEDSKDWSHACTLTGQLFEISQAIFKDERNEKLILQAKMYQLRSAENELENWTNLCAKNDIKNLRWEILFSFRGYFDRVLRTNYVVFHFFKPLALPTYVSDVELLQLLTFLESDKFLEYSGLKPTPRYELPMHDLQCKVDTFKVGITKELINEKFFKADTEVTSSGIGLSVLYLNENGSEKLVLKRLPGQKGLGATFLGNDWVVKNYLGMMPVSGNKTQAKLMALLQDESWTSDFQFEATNSKNPDAFYEVSCTTGKSLGVKKFDYVLTPYDFDAERYLTPFSVGYSGDRLLY